MKKLLKELCSMRGTSGFEHLISEKIKEKIIPYADEVYTDNLGSVIAVKKSGIPNAKKIMIEAHIDEIGLIVTNIDEHGYISFTNIGGVDQRILPSCEVVIHGKKDILGIVSAKPPHIQTADENKHSIKINDMSIDTGYSKPEITKIVSIGDSITFKNDFSELKNGNVCSKTLDDRAGVCALITAMKSLMKIKTDVDIYAVCSISEEVGLRGAKAAAFSVNPDMAIAVDVCHGITPDNSDDAFECGCGVVVSVGPNIHPKLAERLFQTAKKYNIKTETAVESGNTGTDAWVIQTSRNGIPTALLSIPLKYMHTCVETIDTEDLKSTSDLLTFFISELDNTEEWLCF